MTGGRAAGAGLARFGAGAMGAAVGTAAAAASVDDPDFSSFLSEPSRRDEERVPVHNDTIGLGHQHRLGPEH